MRLAVVEEDGAGVRPDVVLVTPDIVLLPVIVLVRQAVSLTSALCKLRQTKVGPRGDPCSMASHLQWCQPA